ncbi:MAG: cytochrome c maturation protein CcmE [Nocardioides sp.]|nr:cytochrome c maturation protein CcmE [Nocardioides sp.]
MPSPPRRGSTRLRVVVCVAIILGALGWIAVRGLTGSFVYYLTPTEVVSGGQAEISQRIRLGGYVEPGSVTRDDRGLTFTVSDGEESIRVVSTGSVPQLFRAGQGVVLEGALGADRLFHADTLLVKHDGEYRAPDPTKGP